MSFQLTDKEYRSLLQNCEREIAAQTNLPVLLPILRTQGLLIQEEFTTLQELPPYERGSHLVRILQKKGGEDAFNRFILALKREDEHLGHGNLVGKLLEERNKMLTKRPPPTLPRRRKISQGPFTPPVTRRTSTFSQVNVGRSKSLHHIDEAGFDSEQEEDSPPPFILDTKEIESEKQVFTPLSENVCVLSQLKHIKNTFTKKLEELNAKMEVVQSAVQLLSQNVVMINENMEALRYSLSASMDYHQNPAVNPEPQTAKYAVSTKKKLSSQFGTLMNPYVEMQSTSLEYTQDDESEQSLQPPPPTYDYVQVRHRKRSEHHYENSPPSKAFNKADYIEVKALSYSQSGEFWLAVNRIDRSNVVIKKLADRTFKEMLGKEIDILEHCQHPNIIKFISADWNYPEHTYLLYFEYAERGHLQGFLQNERASVNVAMLLGMALGVASGMIDLGLRRIVHCDLRASSVLVDSDMVCKIASFGKAQYLKENETHKVCDGFQIATRWQAPEVLNGRKFSIHSDIWSFAVFLAELFSYGEAPYPNMTPVEVKTFVLNKKKMEKPKECPKEAFSLMKDCFKYRADQRSTFTAMHKELKNLYSSFSKKLTAKSTAEFED